MAMVKANRSMLEPDPVLAFSDLKESGSRLESESARRLLNQMVMGQLMLIDLVKPKLLGLRNPAPECFRQPR